MAATIFVAVALLAGATSLFAAVAWLRAGAYLCLVAALLAIWWAALGHPRPALFGVPHGTVVSYALNEPKSIDVLVKPRGSGQPVLWALPWNERDAAALQDAARRAKMAGRLLEMRGRQGGGRAGYTHQHHAGPVFYPAPAPQLPEKTTP
ncbi:MAG: hypothetical protein ACREFP_04070 [Acetobacteraceae bacterium]